VKETKALLLAAGLGTRLKPLTNIWPKCLMPIHGRPLLEYWLNILQNSGINDTLVNTHHFSNYVEEFLGQSQFSNWVLLAYEEELLGTAGTIRKNASFLSNSTILVAHADNWVCCNFTDFLKYHHNKRPKSTVITMMTFVCTNPSSCGIVELEDNGIVVNFHEKVKNPPGNLANAAVYLLEPEVVKWIADHPEVSDFSTEVLPQFMGRISSWENKGVHRDIGIISELKKAQLDKCKYLLQTEENIWQQNFFKNPIHRLIS